MNQLILALILSFLPVSELRAGLPVAIGYAIKNNIPIAFVFLPVILANIIAMFFVFFFLNFLHGKLLSFKLYKRFFNFYISRTRKKVDNFEKKFSVYGFLALTIFVAIPFPATGAWTGSFIAWLLGLDRKKSILAISLGVFIAGIIVLLVSLGVIEIAGLVY